MNCNIAVKKLRMLKEAMVYYMYDPKVSYKNNSVFNFMNFNGKVQVGKDQEKAQSEKDSHSKNRGGKKTKLTIRYLYHETYRKPNEQLFSQ